MTSTSFEIKSISKSRNNLTELVSCLSTLVQAEVLYLLLLPQNFFHLSQIDISFFLSTRFIGMIFHFSRSTQIPSTVAAHISTSDSRAQMDVQIAYATQLIPPNLLA